MQRLSTSKNKRLFQKPDSVILILYYGLVLLGLLSIYSVSFDLGENGGLFSGGRVTSQLIWIGLSSLFGLVILLLDRDLIYFSSPFLYIAMLVLLIATIFLAPDIKGSHSWLVITDSVRLQPAEFAKVTTAMMMAWWTSQQEFNIKRPTHLLVSFLIFLLPMIVIILQAETGSALVFLSFVLVLYREGLPSAVPLLGIFLVILFVLVLRFNGVEWGITPAERLIAYSLIYIALFISTEVDNEERGIPPSRIIALTLLPASLLIAAIISYFHPVDFSQPVLYALILFILFLLGLSVVRRKTKFSLIALVGIIGLGLASGVEYFFEEMLQPHQQSRILVSLGMKDDPAGAGYNVRQSLIAIGSGGLFGKGYMQGTQTKLNYVPEQDTDFIFCTVGEEFGFVGAMLVLLFFLALLIRILSVAERQNDTYARVYGYSVASILFLHFIVNIGMVIGLVPVIGIPLPFFSYGGSSLLGFTIMIAILLRLDATNPQR